MAIAKKHRRKLDHEGRAYVWFVKEDDDCGSSVLYIENETKTLKVQYVLGQTDEDCALSVTGSAFVRTDPTSTWRRFRCPRFDSHGVITPKGVVAIVQWCLSSAETRVPANFYAGSFGTRPDVESYKQSITRHET